MDDTRVVIQQLKDSVAEFIDERDWAQFHSPKNLSMAIATEAAELMELFMWVDSAESYEEAKRRRTEVEHELADIIIVSLAFARQVDIDISRVVMHKIEEIKKKYPVTKAKGRWDKYTAYQEQRKKSE